MGGRTDRIHHPFSACLPWWFCLVLVAAGNDLLRRRKLCDVFAAGISPGQWHTLRQYLFRRVAHRSGDGVADSSRFRANNVAADPHECFTSPRLHRSNVAFISRAARSESSCLRAGRCAGSALLAGDHLPRMYALFRMHDDVRAMQMATVTTGAGLLAWLVLMQIVLIH